MARSFTIPPIYKSHLISSIKKNRAAHDSRKRDITPSIVNLGRLRFKIARHFGLCYGVANAIEIAYKALAENVGKRVFLLSEMIHNPAVNEDLRSRGVRFIMSNEGVQLIPFTALSPEDVVIVPAFGTTIEIVDQLKKLGIDPYQFNTTCPFVEKVWKRAADLSAQGFTVIIHGKPNHEETRATFSHSSVSGPALIIRDITEAKRLSMYIEGRQSLLSFNDDFAGRTSPSFNPNEHLKRIGVVNQTTMLATETLEISNYLKSSMLRAFGQDKAAQHFADTRDTLCYATSENQDAVYGLIESGGDLSIVVGGYNSSNTSHLVEICERHLPTYHIKDAKEIIDRDTLRHLDHLTGQVRTSQSWLPNKEPIDILVTAGASCPDSVVEEVLVKIAELYELRADIGAVANLG